MSVLLLGSMLLMTGFAADRGLSALRQQRVEQQITATTQRSLQRIARELEFAGLGGMSPRTPAPYGAATLTYRVCNGYDEDAGAVSWSPERVLRLEYDGAETNNGADDDGDGMIDECALVWIENEGEADEQRVVLAHSVAEYLQGEEPDGDDDNGNGLKDERGLSFEFDDDVVVLRLSLQGTGPGGQVITRTLETAVSVHN